MNPFLAATLRRHWPLALATVVFVLFMLADQVVFHPAAQRYQAAITRARDLGLSLDPVQVEPVLPPRVYARVTDNALAPAAAIEQANSGVLTARLLEEASQLAQRSALEVIASEPGLVSQQETSTIVRAHLTMRGSYSALVAFLDALMRSPHLIAVDRFTTGPQANSLAIELWVSRLVLKREGMHR